MRIFALSLLLLSSCSDTQVDHRFPTFQEYMEIDSLPLEGDRNFERKLELTSRLTFSDSELEQMYQSSDVEDLIVVNIQAHYDSPRRVDSLEKAISIAGSNKLVVMLTVNHCSYPDALKNYDYCDREVFEALLGLDAQNMLAHYIAAGYSFSIGNYDSAIRELYRGNEIHRYDQYESEFFALLVQKARAFGFPTYVANANAFGSFVQTMHTKPLFDMCSTEIPESHRGIYSECVKMGKNIEDHSKTILAKTLGIGLQVRALEAQEDTDARVNAVESRRESLLAISDGVSDIPSDAYTEEMWEQFYTELFQVGEVAAFKNIIDRVTNSIENDT